MLPGALAQTTTVTFSADALAAALVTLGAGALAALVYFDRRVTRLEIRMDNVEKRKSGRGRR